MPSTYPLLAVGLYGFGHHGLIFVEGIIPAVLLDAPELGVGALAHAAPLDAHKSCLPKEPDLQVQIIDEAVVKVV